MSVFDVQELSVAFESNFAENNTAPGSNTYTYRLPAKNTRMTLNQSRDSDGATQNYQNESRPGYLGIKTGSIEFTVPWPGHQTTAATTLVDTWFNELLGSALGNSTSSSTGTTCTAGSTATAVNVNSAVLAEGRILRVGVAGDAGGAGQAAVVSSTSGGITYNLLTALPAAPAAAAVVYNTLMAYPSETMGSTVRFLCAWDDTYSAFHLMGCQAEAISISLEIGKVPEVTFRYRVAYWDNTNTAVPGALTMSNCDAAPLSGGSVFFNTVGTSTRATLSPSRMELSLDMPLLDKMGPAAGQAPYQVIYGYDRQHIVPTLSLTIPWANDTMTFGTDGSETSQKHILVTCNPHDKRSVGFYLPRAYPVGDRPTPVSENGQTYQRITYRGRESSVTTNELTRSPIRFFMG